MPLTQAGYPTSVYVTAQDIQGNALPPCAVNGTITIGVAGITDYGEIMLYGSVASVTGDTMWVNITSAEGNSGSIDPATAVRVATQAQLTGSPYVALCGSSSSSAYRALHLPGGKDTKWALIALAGAVGLVLLFLLLRRMKVV